MALDANLPRQSWLIVPHLLILHRSLQSAMLDRLRGVQHCPNFKLLGRRWISQRTFPQVSISSAREYAWLASFDIKTISTPSIATLYGSERAIND